MKKSYFIVSYVATHIEGQLTANASVTSNSAYINGKTVLKQLIKFNEGKVKDLAIINVIKLTKKQYKIWIKQ